MRNLLSNILALFLFLGMVYAKYPDASASNGMVVSSHKLASQAGIDVLKNGGNAIDAAVAVGFALAVVHPGAGNIGGGGFMVIRFADGSSTTIDFRETAPQLAGPDMFLDDDGNVIKGKSWSSSYAVGVPGTVAGLGYVHNKYGTERWYKLLQPAIQMAKFGHDVNYLNLSLLNSSYYRQFLSNDEETKKIFYKDKGFKLRERFVQKDLASTLSRIAHYGYNEFYTGKTAEYIIECMNRTNGLISIDDLKNYKPIEREPIIFDYRDNRVITMPPASSGGIVLAEILNQLEYLDMDTIGYHSSKHIHYMSEVEKRAYADRAEALGDMDFVDIPIDIMTSDDYAKKKWLTVDCCKSTPYSDIEPIKSKKANESEETTHYSVVDKWGNAVSVTTTINGWYGSGITVDKAGFLLNNEMDDFSSKPGHPNKYGLVGSWANSIKPNKRMLSSMTPTIVEDNDGELFLVVGSPGGSTIITTVAQIISNIIDYGMPLKDAVESPRTRHQWLPDKIFLENKMFGSDVYNKLIDLGHDIEFKRSIGEANCIMYDKRNKIFFGVNDSRRKGEAVGY